MACQQHFLHIYWVCRHTKKKESLAISWPGNIYLIFYDAPHPLFVMHPSLHPIIIRSFTLLCHVYTLVDPWQAVQYGRDKCEIWKKVTVTGGGGGHTPRYSYIKHSQFWKFRFFFGFFWMIATSFWVTCSICTIHDTEFDCVFVDRPKLKYIIWPFYSTIVQPTNYKRYKQSVLISFIPSLIYLHLPFDL